MLLLAAVCEIILPGPEAAARAAAAASNKKRNEAEAAIADAVSRALHMLGSLKQIVSLVAGQLYVELDLCHCCLAAFIMCQPQDELKLCHCCRAALTMWQGVSAKCACHALQLKTCICFCHQSSYCAVAQHTACTRLLMQKPLQTPDPTLEAQVSALMLPSQTSARQIYLAGNVVGPLSKMLLKLYVLRQPMLSRSTTDCLEMLCSAKNSHLGSAALGELLQQVLQQEAAWDRKDTDLMLALTSLIESGFTR